MTIPVSLKIQDSIFKDLETMRIKANIPRNTYINQAIDFYNKSHRRKWLKKQLAYESKLTKKSSIKVLKEFEALEDFIFE